MDEQAFARRAVRRGLLTEEQFREATTFAEGGRSLLSVLLDLGYIRTQDVETLHEPASSRMPPPKKRSVIPVFLTASIIGFLLGRGCGDGGPPPQQAKMWRAPPPVPQVETVRHTGAIERLNAAYVERGWEHLKPALEPDLKITARLLEKLRQLDPADVAILVDLGRVREILGDTKLALEAYEMALAAEPDQRDALIGAARCALALGKNWRAHQFADRACQLRTDWQAHYLRGLSYVGMEKPIEGLDDLELAAKLRPALRTRPDYVSARKEAVRINSR